MVEAIRCDLCGAVAKFPVTKTIDGREINFCCNGCLQVYELTRDEDQSEEEMHAQLQTKQAGAVVHGYDGPIPLKTIILPILGMSCANCVAHVERGLRLVPGVINVNVNLATERAIVEVTTNEVTIADLKKAVKDVGYEALDEVDSLES